MYDFMSAGEAFAALKEKRGILIDIRSREDYRKGHLPGAEHIPLSEILNGSYQNNSLFQSVQSDQEEDREKDRKQIRKDIIITPAEDTQGGEKAGSKAVIVYCASGVSSLQAVVKLSEDGYQSYSISGGLADYKGQLISLPDGE